MTVGTPWKKSTPSKIWGHLKPSLFENLIGGSTTSPTISSIVDEIFIELKIYHAFMPSKDFLFSFFPFPSLFSPMIFQNLKNYCILYIYIYMVCNRYVEVSVNSSCFALWEHQGAECSNYWWTWLVSIACMPLLSRKDPV